MRYKPESHLGGVIDTKRVREWYQSRLDIADAIVSRFNDEGLFDAEIILCCALSAISSRIWPKESDRARYVQLLIDFAPDQAEVTKISVPRLQARLMTKGDVASANLLETHFLTDVDSRILTATEVDQPPEVVKKLLSAVPLKFIRESSYAGIMYKDLRCGLVHEYSLGPHMVDFGMSHIQNELHYVNMVAVPDLNFDSFGLEDAVLSLI